MRLIAVQAKLSQITCRHVLHRQDTIGLMTIPVRGPDYM